MTGHRPTLRARGPGLDDRAWLARIVDQLPVGVRIDDGDGEPLYANRRDAEIASDEKMSRTRHDVLVDGARYAVTFSADVSGHHAREDELFQRAFFDELTGLPNRALIERSVDNLVAEADAQTRFALAFIDVDNFKHINDYYGHDAGDQLLIKIARRISESIRKSDMLARVGGDELLLLLSPADSLESVAETMDRVLARLKEPYFIDGHEIFSSASIGVSLYPLHGENFASLRINADNAMYRIKSATKGGIRIFDPQIGHAVTERMKLEQRLRTAIRDRRLCCAFQPKVDFRAGSVTGVEVLLRWRDEEGVIQAPGDFVKLAVELGLMDDITLQVLAEAVRLRSRIDDIFGPTVTISLNVAPKQANDVRFMRSFVQCIAATRCPERFMVELTEEAFLARTQFQTHVLPLLREVGTRVSIDDFGVGFSSLSALADITADEVKVDRCFITDIHKRPRNQSILAAIESLCGALGMQVVVEGVETVAELTFLQAASRIRVAQGYYFAKPIMLDEPVPSGALAWFNRQPETARERGPNRKALNRRG